MNKINIPTMNKINIPTMNKINIPTGENYEPGAQIRKAKSKSNAKTPEQIIKNII